MTARLDVRWHSAHALSSDDLQNLVVGRVIEQVTMNQRVPLDDGGFLDFPFAFKLLGVPTFIGFHDGQPYVLRYWRPV